MTEPRQFTNVFTGNVGGAIQASNTVPTVIAAANTPVQAANAWAVTGDLSQVVANAQDLEAAHANGGARSYHVSFQGRVQKAPGPPSNCRVHLYLNGAPMSNPLFREIDLRGNDPASEFSMHTAVTLVPTDTISVWLENLSNTNNLTLIEGATLSIAS